MTMKRTILAGLLTLISYAAEAKDWPKNYCDTDEFRRFAAFTAGMVVGNIDRLADHIKTSLVAQTKEKFTCRVTMIWPDGKPFTHLVTAPKSKFHIAEM